MQKKATKLTLGLLILLIAAGITYWATKSTNTSQEELSVIERAQKQAAKLSEEGEEEEEGSKFESKKARYEYFFRMLRDPATNSIPKNIRQRELRHAKQMPTLREVNSRRKAKNPSFKAVDFTWLLAGPPAVGGRTRALGVDQRNSNIIIAGGVSGGVWKSTNGGTNWDLKTPDLESFSVTSLAQDPTNPDTWYYVSGEFTGNSAASRETAALPAPYYGTGVFRSTDNGENWSRIPSTADKDIDFNSQFDYVSRVVVSPTTGSVFITSNGFGIYRAPNGNDFGSPDQPALGGFGEHAYADVSVASNGTLAAVLSSIDAGASGGNPGIFVSADDGQSWNEVTPDTFPDEHFRSVLAFAPSDPSIIYILTQKNPDSDPSNQGVSFHMIDLSTNGSEDRSANLPDFGGSVGGVNLQLGYNMTISVKPDNPEVVTLGGTNLFRSFDGFSTAPEGDSEAEKNEFWIGGYAKANDVSQYPNNHPDQHVQVYDPNDSNRLWAGHDGGLSVTDDVEATSVSWTDRNEGYIVTQFYDASIAPGGDDNRFMGGTQDNGTPFFEFRDEQDIGNPSADISSGDGGFSFFSENYIFVSNQQGASGNNRVIRFNGDLSGSIAIVQPSQAQTAFFINPYTIDPNDEGVMYYPGGSDLFRNTEVDEITNQSGDGATKGWNVMEGATLTGYNISALEVSTTPADILYYAGSNAQSPPVIRRIDNASTSDQDPINIDIPDVTGGAFVHDIAINPANANDVLVVMSNYNIIGLYHTSDGGNTWGDVEGNLEGDNLQGALDHGPSLRSATIVPSEEGSIYVLGTSTGVYASQGLDGDLTLWGRESVNDNDGTADIGFAVVENIASRFSNGDIAVGTHGHGMFVGRFGGTISIPSLPAILLDPTEGRAETEVTLSATNFHFSTTASGNNVFFGDVRAEVVEATASQITVIVPRATLEPTDDDRIIFVSVDLEEGTDPQPRPFTILPPNENRLDQNFPNPFTAGETANIPISLQGSSEVTLVLYDISGRLVDEPIKDKLYRPGTYNIPVNMNGKASGIYIYRIIAKPTVSSGKIFMDSKKFTFIK